MPDGRATPLTRGAASRDPSHVLMLTKTEEQPSRTRSTTLDLSGRSIPTTLKRPSYATRDLTEAIAPYLLA